MADGRVGVDGVAVCVVLFWGEGLVGILLVYRGRGEKRRGAIRNEQWEERIGGDENQIDDGRENEGVIENK